MTQTRRTETGNNARRPLLIVAGPTASGKSALALALAQRHGGCIINADAMQCYQNLRILTARPSPADEALVPHHLYGVRDAAQPANAAWWRDEVREIIQHNPAPILCGGTGMYLAALLRGIAPIPDPGAAARAEARALLAEIGAPALHAKLLAADPQTASKLFPTDSQRISRAWEVWRGTGHGLAHWQALPTQPLTGWHPRMVLLAPPREALRAAIEARFTLMLAAGALAEVATLIAQKLHPALPLLRAHGVPELSAHLRGEISLGEATSRAVLATTQYTKRQATWFNGQKLVDKPDLHIIHARIDSSAQFSESQLDDLRLFINNPA